MSSRICLILLVAAVTKADGGCEGCDTNLPPLGFAHCSTGNTLFNLRELLVTGTIKDFYSVSQEFSDPNYSNTKETYQTELTAVLNLKVQDGVDGVVSGTAQVTWKRHDQLYYRQSPAVCADGENIDSNVRQWTVNITGKLFCASDGKVGIQGSGSPDGSDIPTTLHYQDYGCHSGCAPCYDQTGGTSELVTWNSFDERGFDGNALHKRTDLAVPSPFTGESYHEVTLDISENTSN